MISDGFPMKSHITIYFPTVEWGWVVTEQADSGQLRQAQYINTLGLYDPNMQEIRGWAEGEFTMEYMESTEMVDGC